MNSLAARARILAAASLLATSACDRSDNDDPPLIPLPAARATGAPATLTSEPSPPALPQPPQPPQPPATASSSAPSPTPAGTTPIAFTPFPIPWPISLPSAFPALPFPLPAPSGTPSATPAPNSVQPASDARVIVYGTQWCPACDKLKKHLDARGVPYTFVDVEDQKARASPAGQHVAEMPPEMRRGVPVTRVMQKNGAPLWVQGDDPDRIERGYRG